MSTVMCQRDIQYPFSLESPLTEQALPVELSRFTSSLQTDKVFQQNYDRRSPLTLYSSKESYSAFWGELLRFNEEDEDDQISRNALMVVAYVVAKAYVLSPGKWRNPRLASDGDGGVRLTWKLREKEIRAVFPADMRHPHYLYKEKGELHSTIKNFTSHTLAEHFDWLLSNA